MAIDHEIYWQPQSQNMSCWAASTAMMIGYRDQVSYPESEVLKQFADFGVDGADDAECARLAYHLGFNILPNQCALPEAWEQMLQRGPIMVGSPTHVIVIAGISGDGTPEDSHFHILDPARGDFWGPYMDVETQYELNPDAGYENNLFQW